MQWLLFKKFINTAFFLKKQLYNEDICLFFVFCYITQPVAMVTIVCSLYSSLNDWWGLHVLSDSCIFNILTPQTSCFILLLYQQ